MNNWLWLAAVLAGLGCAYAGVTYLPRWQFRRAMRRRFPDSWLAHLQSLPVYAKLPPALQRELRDKVQAFLYRKRFAGCEGLAITDEIRVVIAAEACLLLLNRPSTEYRDLRWVYVFPSSFRSKTPERDSSGVVSRPAGSLLGVSWSNGRVVLAWDSVKRGVAQSGDGHNVVLHEFAHQLDQEDGVADGAPLLYSRESYRVWSRVLSGEFEQLQQDVMQGHHSLIDPYGATNAAEFFAVVTELFYERPDAMQQHPALFTALKNYYCVDPRDWRGT